LSTELLRTIPEVRHSLAEVRRRGCTVGFVPTMGALHAAHGALIRRAREESDAVVVSIFVNPIQFDRGEDYDRYPRTLPTDVEFCTALGVDVVFAPDASEMYAEPQLTFVEVSSLSERLCGEFRPGHFRGVATVVSKLFNVVQPDKAYFGEKDAQQLAIVRKMVADLNVPVTIVAVATVREPDGLAMSSRNRRLDAEQRRIAPTLYQALQTAAQRIASGATSPEEVRGAALAVLRSQPGIGVEYLEIVDPERMQPVERIVGPVCVAGAVWIGSTRLIDNLLGRPPAAVRG
jgi:pantoate--beta-alanine ligase